MTFRDRLLASLRAAEPVLDVPGVMIAGSQVPNLLQPDADSTLVVSDDVDIVVPVSAHAKVKQRLLDLRGYRPSPDDQRRTVMANLALLSLLRPIPGMPDPTTAREVVASLIRRLEAMR